MRSFIHELRRQPRSPRQRSRAAFAARRRFRWRAAGGAPGRWIARRAQALAVHRRALARGHAGRGQRISRRRRRAGGDLAARVHAAPRRVDGGRHRRGGLPQAEREDHPLRAAPRGADSRQPAPLRDRLCARGIHERPLGREPRRAPDQGRGEPRAPRDAGRDHRHRAGADPRPLRRRSRQAAAPRQHPDRLADVPLGAEGAVRLAGRQRRRRAAVPDRPDHFAAAGRPAPADPGALPAREVRQLLVGRRRRRDRGGQAGVRPPAHAAPPPRSGRGHSLARRRLPQRRSRADPPGARIFRPPRALARHEPPLRRRAGHDGHRRDGRSPHAPARRRHLRLRRRPLRDALRPGPLGARPGRLAGTRRGALGLEVAGRAGGRSGEEPRPLAGHRRSPAAGCRARAGRGHQQRRSATSAPPSSTASRSPPMPPRASSRFARWSRRSPAGRSIRWW